MLHPGRQPLRLIKTDHESFPDPVRYAILDTDPEAPFDDLVRLAANICQAPIALISLIDPRRQWFKAKVGMAADETSRDVAFCAHAILQRDIFEVPDALADERLATNPLVTGGPGMRFYAGVPLVNADGYALGTLCVIDRVPRQLTTDQKQALAALGRQLDMIAIVYLRQYFAGVGARESAAKLYRFRAANQRARVGLQRRGDHCRLHPVVAATQLLRV